MKASSQYDEDHQAAYGRLQGKRGDAWCAEEAERNDDWLQVDLGKTFEVCAVSTQGDMHDEHWVTTFKVSYSSNGHSWKTYTKYGKEVVSVKWQFLLKRSIAFRVGRKFSLKLCPVNYLRL